MRWWFPAATLPSASRRAPPSTTAETQSFDGRSGQVDRRSGPIPRLADRLARNRRRRRVLRGCRSCPSPRSRRANCRSRARLRPRAASLDARFGRGCQPARSRPGSPHRPLIASTVESLRLLLADGRIVRCSRTEHPELFAAVLGGYGLFGIILDADLRVVPNVRYRVAHRLVSSAGYPNALAEAVRSEPVGLAYGRLNLTRERFLEQAMLTTFVRTSEASPAEPMVELAPWAASIERWIFRGSQGSEYGKNLRWELETNLSGWFFSGTTHRNQVLQGRVELYENRDPSRTDVLHEYFVPVPRLEEFLGRVRDIVPAHGADLLNVTLRDVRQDADTMLPYAAGDVMALVFFFSQPRNTDADLAMQALTRDLIEASLAVGGRFYLPYRLHATREQFERAYPTHGAFFTLKRAVDPDEVFQNQLYRAYGPPRPARTSR